MKFPLVGFVDTDKQLVEAKYKNWNELFKGLRIEKPDDYLVDVYTTDKSAEERWYEYYINIIITKDSYKVYAYKEFYEDYIKSPFYKANISLLSNSLQEHAVELFMRGQKNFPLKKFMLLDSEMNGLVMYNGSSMKDVTYHYYEVAVL